MGKTFLQFSWRFLLGNFIWIALGFVYLMDNKLLTCLFLSFLVYYGYISWVYFTDKNALIIKRISVGIQALYSLSVIGFLILTGISTYIGISEVFGMTGTFQHFFVALLALMISLILFAFTLIIKASHAPYLVMLFIGIYVICDGLTALPFNFLFFYQNVQRAALVQKDEENIKRAIILCDSVINPKLKAASGLRRYYASKRKTVASENDANDARKLSYDEGSLDKLLHQGIIKQDEYSARYRHLQGKYRPVAIRSSETEKAKNDSAFRDSSRFKSLILQLDSCKQARITLDNVTNTATAATICGQTEQRLIQICNGSLDRQLISYGSTLNIPRRSALETIEDLYVLIWHTIIHQENPSGTGDKGDKQPQKSDMLMNMSLSTSIVIDILPLFFSILYAKFKREY